MVKAGDYLVARYMEVDGYSYGELLDGQFEVLARLPYLVDVSGDTLIFDYPTGNLRESRIYNMEELEDIVND